MRPFSSPGVSSLLKLCLFATGCAGIVAEFVLCTLATYFLGNAVLQWTLMMSLMLFAMGLGSHLSRYCSANLLDTFTVLEFSLSLLCASAAASAYVLSPFLTNAGVVIYPLGIAIGLLIGMEIPLITRVNAGYEELRVNISAVMEKDYYGALIGGLFFAFVGLPYLGLTYTPVALGAVNFGVASLFLFRFRSLLSAPRLLSGVWAVVGAAIIGLFVLAEPIILFGEQALYKDTVILVKQTPYQRLVMTRWRNDYWLYINGNQQFSSYDEERYHEPLVHPALALAGNRAEVLILGGGDGLAVREVLKYSQVKAVTLVDLDPEMTTLAATHPVFLQLNDHALGDSRVSVVNADAFSFLQDTSHLFDTIIIDLPDPNSVELARLYSLNFYRLCKKHLKRGGTLVTQATSPFFSRQAFVCIQKTMAEAGFSVLPYHNHVPTLGEWGFVLGVDAGLLDATALKETVQGLSFQGVETRFLNQDAMIAMVHFGKGVFRDEGEIEVNRESQPVLQSYYRQGRWEVY